jgi:hypothetical protein
MTNLFLFKGSYKVMSLVDKMKDVDAILGPMAYDLDLEEFIGDSRSIKC